MTAIIPAKQRLRCDDQDPRWRGYRFFNFEICIIERSLCSYSGVHGGMLIPSLRHLEFEVLYYSFIYYYTVLRSMYVTILRSTPTCMPNWKTFVCTPTVAQYHGSHILFLCLTYVLTTVCVRPNTRTKVRDRQNPQSIRFSGYVVGIDYQNRAIIIKKPISGPKKKFRYCTVVQESPIISDHNRPTISRYNIFKISAA